MRWLILFTLTFTACKANAVTLTITVDSIGNANCCVHGEVNGKLLVQQFRWNKWVSMYTFGSFETWKDTCVDNRVMLHSGVNQFRLVVAPNNPTQDSLFSTVFVIGDERQQVNCGLARVCGPSDRFTLNAVSYWEIYDQYGTIIKSGTSLEIPVSDLPKGGYFLNYDNCTAEFFKQ